MVCMKELTLLLAGMVFLFGCTSGVTSDGTNHGNVIQEPINDNPAADEPDNENHGEDSETREVVQEKDTPEEEIMVTNGVRHLVPLEDIRQGCFGGLDCIPSIDEPKFESAAQGNTWLSENSPVLGLDYKGEQIAYPLGIMNWHEIVNDTVAGDAIVVTYCPLCGTGLAFERTLDSEAVEFGVSGKLYNSDLVMYDRKTETYWSQIDGLAIAGQLTGQRLNRVPIETIAWGDWVKKFPNTKVLSRETGFLRDYNQYPYGDYEESTDIFFPVSGKDGRLHEKTIVHGIELNGKFKAYLEDALEKGEVLEDEFAGEKLEIERDEITGGVKVFILDENGERDKELVAVRGFWFAWFAFHPGTELYQG